MEDKRFYCTAQSPWTKADGRSVHEDAVMVRQADNIAFSYDNKIGYRCPHCELEFEHLAHFPKGVLDE